MHYFFSLVTYKVSSFKIQDRVALSFVNTPTHTCHLRLISPNGDKFQPSSTTGFVDMIRCTSVTSHVADLSPQPPFLSGVKGHLSAVNVVPQTANWNCLTKSRPSYNKHSHLWLPGSFHSLFCVKKVINFRQINTNLNPGENPEAV